MSNNANQILSQKVRDDEFYTPYYFVQEEVDRYASQLEGKVIYCPCDNPRWSNFVRYFVENFNKLNLKAVLCTYYEGSEEEGGTHVCWAIHNKKNVPEIIYNIVNSENGWSYNSNEAKSVRATMESNGWNIDSEIEVGYAKKNAFKKCCDNGMLFDTKKGSFNSYEASVFADFSDVIITNPPFSKFVSFVDFLLKSNKKFLVVGSNVAISKNNVFKAWKNGWIRGGYSCHVNCSFTRPDGTEKIVPVTWYTNMEVLANHEEIKTGKLMKDCKCKYYDERKDVMYLSTYKDYPDDYYGLCAIPVNAFYRYSSEFFEVCEPNHFCDMKVDGKELSQRVVIRRKQYKNEISVEDIVAHDVLKTIAPVQSNGRGYVYIFADEHNRIKIGVTINPAQERLNQLQTGNADELSVLFVSNPVFGYEEVEQKVHEAFKDYHVRLEWFEDKCFAKAVKMITEMTAPSKQDVKRFRNI